jgi:raffinose/stachyose/melibiose transport system substrate-binding protein
MFTGSWEVASFEGKGISFFTLPQKSTLGDFGEAWHITSVSKNPSVAAEYLNFITSPQSEKAFVRVGDIPANPVSIPRAKPLFRQALSAWNILDKRGYPEKLLEWAFPDSDQILAPDIQELMAGRKTPQQVVKDTQAAWEKFQASQG